MAETCRLGIICWPGTRRRSYFLVFLSLLGVGDPADAEDVVRSGGATERMFRYWRAFGLQCGQEPSDGRTGLDASPGQNGHRMGGVTLLCK